MAMLAIVMLLGGILVWSIRCCVYETSRRLQIGFVAVLVAGCAVAMWSTFFFKYQPNPSYRIEGFPIPVVVFHLENGNWVDFVGPGWIMNFILVPSLVAMPVSVTLIVRAVRRRNFERRRGFPVVPNRP